MQVDSKTAPQVIIVKPYTLWFQLYPQIDAICPNQFGTFWKYTERYCDAHTVFFGRLKKRECK